MQWRSIVHGCKVNACNYAHPPHPIHGVQQRACVQRQWRSIEHVCKVNACNYVQCKNSEFPRVLNDAGSINIPHMMTYFESPSVTPALQRWGLVQQMPILLVMHDLPTTSCSERVNHSCTSSLQFINYHHDSTATPPERSSKPHPGFALHWSCKVLF